MSETNHDEIFAATLKEMTDLYKRAQIRGATDIDKATFTSDWEKLETKLAVNMTADRARTYSVDSIFQRIMRTIMDMVKDPTVTNTFVDTKVSHKISEKLVPKFQSLGYQASSNTDTIRISW